MNTKAAVKPFLNLITIHSLPFLKENRKIIAQFIFTLLFLGLGIWFIKHQRTELQQVKTVLGTAGWQLILVATAFTLIYIALQGLMYVASFRAIKCRIPLSTSIILFLKRNFVSVFLPAGGVSSLAFFTSDVSSKGISKNQIHFASSIYGFIGILSVVVVAIPVFIYAITGNSVGSGEWFALITVAILLIALIFLYRSITGKKGIYNFLVKMSPSLEVFVDEINANQISTRDFLITLGYSVLIEFVGIAHLYIAMAALNCPVSFQAAALGYIVSVIFLIISPFLRGLGAIEVSMSYVLVKFGYSNVNAIAITLFYRFFEFWLPLLLGILSFLMKVNKLLMRILPALLLFMLGILNIISVLTPAISSRLSEIKDLIPIDAIRASNYFVMLAGLFLLVTAAFMLKGLRSAWWFAVCLSAISVFGHLIKAIDYEEATAALFVLVILIVTHKDYYVKNNPRLRFVGIQTALLSTLAVMVYGTIGFYFLDKKHFHMDFSLLQSIRYTIQNYFLVGSSEILPYGKFARDFILSINISGFLSISFLIYTLIRPYVIKTNSSPEVLDKAKDLVSKYGKSSLDYFKTSLDKLIFIPENSNAFLAYRVAGNYAVVLENPVAEDSEQMKLCIKEFDDFCRNNGLQELYYRVPENSLTIYRELGKRSLFLGQEAIVDLTTFSLEGGQKKAMRNALNKVRERGYKSTIHKPPLKDGLLQRIKSVSDDWLKETGRSEIIFSQGMFIWEELKQQTVITVENAEEKVVAFLNIVPSFAENEATYDLIRKTPDAPNGIMDFILVELFLYLKQNGYKYVNMGFAPLSGLSAPQNFPEKSMKFAYEKIRSFAHYKGLRDFKDKFFPTWYNKYLIYETDYDLLQSPAAISKVIRP